MRVVWNTLLKGLAAVLPIGLTIFLIYWLGSSAEALLGGLIRRVVPEQAYWPGMGLAVGLALLLLAGMLVNAWIVRRLLGLGEALLERIPLVKTVYGAMRDFMQFVSPEQERKDLRRVVLARFGEARLIGFVTREDVADLIPGEVGGPLVAVYFPLSYQIGGYTAYLPRESLQPLDLSVEDAMRLALTAGLSTQRKRR